MWVESKIGEGSTFYFTTPYETNFVNIPKDSKNIEEEGKVDFRKIVALIVEDDEISEMLIDAYINPFSNKIFKARNGKSAVEMCRDNPDINLIMMDIRLPDMGGYKATEQIRYFNKDVIIVAQTAYAYQEDKEKAKLAGCNDFLVKPIVKKELLTVLEKYFGK